MMTSVLYISPSVLPSRTANSVHVVHQCSGFSSAGADVTLVARRSVRDASQLSGEVEKAYGVSADALRLETFFRKGSRADSIVIALFALATVWPWKKWDMILSRNLYASYLIGVLFRRRLMFETHQVETGIRGRLQRALMVRDNVVTIVISYRLFEILAETHGCQPAHRLILHDAAPAGIARLESGEKRAELARLVPGFDLDEYRAVCGYFGHLYQGRGIEIVAQMAASRPECAFLVFGGNDDDIVRCRETFKYPNLHFAGFVSHAVAQAAMAACDVLVMPYQRSVLIGAEGQDTARWMSPMKMFEYMASGTPLISSDLPVLREVLSDGKNALLAPTDDIDAWCAQLDRLISQPEFAAQLAGCAHEEYLNEYNWLSRAQKILAAGVHA
tara:strand:+ start:21526 stop:22689 length:1164 start_codon:yes stop_codon:yes gene_type:complete